MYGLASDGGGNSFQRAARLQRISTAHKAQLWNMGLGAIEVPTTNKR
jgi:hypothetical protein